VVVLASLLHRRRSIRRANGLFDLPRRRKGRLRHLEAFCLEISSILAHVLALLLNAKFPQLGSNKNVIADFQGCDAAAPDKLGFSGLIRQAHLSPRRPRRLGATLTTRPRAFSGKR
jgi:hypothetical protein